jgi:hypothetical protein
MMISYFDFFPERTKSELRTATFVDDGAANSIPVGTYLFTEYFCTDPQCNCQRVLVKVLRVESEDTRPREVATISYTWNESSDDVWSEVQADMPNPFLDPFHFQASYAPELLEFWSDMMERDANYAARIECHYHELRAAHISSVDEPWDSPRKAPTTTVAPTLTRQQRRARERALARAKRAR